MTNSANATLGELTHQFALQLPVRLVAIQAAFANDAALASQSQLEVLHYLVHGLTGAAQNRTISAMDFRRLVTVPCAPMIKVICRAAPSRQ